MRDLGLRAYRFSISWSRVLPEGRGRINEKGLDFYRRLVDALLAAGIKPVVTLYHWDLPEALDDRGGWLNRDVADWFADYARVMFRALDDRVEMWSTLNEPWVVTDGGYLHGVLAPGHRNLFEAPIASHNLLLAHAAGVEAYRAEGKHRIGLVVNIEPKYPASESEEDLAATRRADAYMNRQYLDPVIHGRYPDEMREIFGEAWPDFAAEDLARIRQPIDFLGINYYTRSVTRHEPTALPVRAVSRAPEAPRLHGDRLGGLSAGAHGYAGLGPATSTATSRSTSPRTAPPSTIRRRPRARCRTRCGWTTCAPICGPPAQAIDQGVDLRGYFAWSLLDNLEWSLGFAKRFGIVHVDFETLRRTPKASARFYSEVIRTHGAVLG